MQQAVQSARELGDPIFLSEALVALAQAQLEGGDPQPDKNLDRGAELSARIGTPELN